MREYRNKEEGKYKQKGGRGEEKLRRKGKTKRKEGGRK